MCGCNLHYSLPGPCTCRCPDHEGYRLEDAARASEENGTPRIFTATHPDGSQTLVTLWDETTGEVATRPDAGARWGVPTALEVAP